MSQRNGITNLRTRQRIGKYVIRKKIGEGGFAVVYRASDTIEGRLVALKIPHSHLVTADAMEDFRREVRLAARLEHPNVLQLKNADYIDGHFVIVTEVGEMTLADRLRRRLSSKTAIHFTRQMLAAVAYAHQQNIIHCDIKPDNFVIFSDQQLKLTDFGIAKIAQRTIKGSGTGTVGYIAPEQALGKPSQRSDVFSLGLILYRMFSGTLPDWPFEWPPPNFHNLQRRLDPAFCQLIRKSMHVQAKLRFTDAGQMLEAFSKIKQPIRNDRSAKKRKRTKQRSTIDRSWESVRRREFMRQYGKSLQSRFDCSRCQGPVSESMTCCPWCGKTRKKHPDESSFPAHCPRCSRGMKLDWCYCPWCYGEGFEPWSTRQFHDKRYATKCTNKKCERKSLMPFMRYCPWCRHRVKQAWKITGSSDTCQKCGWGILSSFWSHCPWCAKRILRGGD